MQSNPQVPVFALQDAATSLNNGDATAYVNQFRFNTGGHKTYHAIVNGVGPVSATIVIETSNDGIHWLTPGLTTFNLSGTDFTQSGFVSPESWAFIRANITAISGTNAAVTVLLGL